MILNLWMLKTNSNYLDPSITSFSFEELDELPNRLLKELNETGGYWQLFTIWAQK